MDNAAFVGVVVGFPVIVVGEFLPRPVSGCGNGGLALAAGRERGASPLGCVYCIVAFPWLLSELIIVLLFLILNISKSNFIISPFMNILKDICFILFTSHYFWIFIAGMPLLYMIDYSLGLCRWQKRQKR